ncbi:helix-turn-helix domain-containing protein [Paenibacillus hamazuiensis]|uniref:helix-turn-helix domain-containing protein n=1 Tax=Paenibacillus hamazuiensis TaxID=2936508 RepID=UPI00200CB4A4
MGPVRKAFFEDPLFPFELVFKDTKSPQSELPDHLHDRYEIVYVYSGSGTFFINQSFYDMKAGDIFIIPGNTIHRAFPDTDDPVTSTALFFAPAFAHSDALDDAYSSLHVFEIVRKRKQFKLDLPSPPRGRTEDILQEMSAEMTAKQPGHRHAVRLLLHRLLLVLNRFAQTDLPKVSDGIPIGPSWMNESLQHIDRHHAEPGLGLSVLAQRAAVTASHFSRVFKQLTGMKVTDYINAKRIVHAKELLAGSDDSIDTIAAHCGFESLPYFHRTFKALAGCTPGVYRREIRSRE